VQGHFLASFAEFFDLKLALHIYLVSGGCVILGFAGLANQCN